MYRRDEIDRTHYPAFHQMEAVAMYPIEFLIGCAEKSAFDPAEMPEMVQNPEYRYCEGLSEAQRLKALSATVQDLKETHENLIRFLLGSNDVKMRWVKGYFPFTEPSFELEVFFNDDWVEMLGCGWLSRRDSPRRDQKKREVG